MKSKLFTITISVLLISLVFTEGYSVRANPNIYASMPKLQITSPVENVTYTINPVSFVVEGEVMQKQYVNQALPSFSCNLDGMDFSVNAIFKGNTTDGWMTFTGKISLSDLANGTHSVSVSQISNSQIARMLPPASVSFNVTNSKSAITPIAPEFSVKFGGNISFPELDGYYFPSANSTIKKPPVATYTQSGLKTDIYYYIRWKEHSNTSWLGGGRTVAAVESVYTEYSIPLISPREDPKDPQVSGLVDFQMSAQTASFTATNVFVSQKSEWSNTQTISIPASCDSPTISPNKESNPVSIPLTWALGVMAVLVVLVGSLLLFRRRRRVSKQQTSLT